MRAASRTFSGKSDGAGCAAVSPVVDGRGALGAAAFPTGGLGGGNISTVRFGEAVVVADVAVGFVAGLVVLGFCACAGELLSKAASAKAEK